MGIRSHGMLLALATLIAWASGTAHAIPILLDSTTVLRSLAFDPFGGRKESDWSKDITQAALDDLIADADKYNGRGFTDHEHLNRTGIIHMNGRIYDPRLGRFLQPDPIVQSPFFSQSYNRYAYVFNSPMSFVDLSGFCSFLPSPDGSSSDGCSFAEEIFLAGLGGPQIGGIVGIGPYYEALAG